MSVNLSSGIVPLSQETISRPPKYTQANTQQQPTASTPMTTDETAPKSSHWFLKTIGAIVVIGAALGLGRKYVPALKNINLSQAADEGAKWYQKGLRYVAQAGEYINNKAVTSWNWIKALPSKIGIGKKAEAAE